MYAKAVTDAIEFYESWTYTHPEKSANSPHVKSFMWDAVNEWGRFLPKMHQYNIRMAGKTIREI